MLRNQRPQQQMGRVFMTASLAVCVGVLLCMWASTADAARARNRRQRDVQLTDTADQPKMVTQQGHLIFQTGTNHNITFNPGPDGHVRVGDQDLLVMADTVNDNSAAIKDLQNGGIPADVQDQLNEINTDVSNLQSSVTQLGTDVNSNKAAIEDLQNGGIPADVQDQLNDIKADVSNLQSTVTQLQTDVSSLQQSVSTMTNKLDTNECAPSNPCSNGATCINLYHADGTLGYQCLCVAGWTGSMCTVDVNECAVIIGTEDDCQNSGQCVNTVGSYRCTCTPDWYGPHCTIRYDDCSSASHTDLCGHGFCVNDQRAVVGQPQYSCMCMDGWQTDGTSNPACIQDVDECAALVYPCSSDPRVDCVNLPGTFYCAPCPTGYTGSGYQCADINECLTNNGGCSQAPLVQCVNTPGSSSCGSCPSGYNGDGVICQLLGVCNTNNGDCSPYATCTESSGTPSGRICTCMPGYTGSGEGTNGCTATPGTTCSDSPCVNGRCEVVGTTYQCICDPGWTGSQCGTDIDECAVTPCHNGGTCQNLVNDFYCLCADGFTGDTCDDTVQSCGGYLSGDNGHFEFPPQGTIYDHDLSCAWVITVTSDKVVRIVFTRFELEYHTNCNYDFLQINDGSSASAQLIGVYCGSTVPDSITSTHNTMYFWFRTDGSVAYEGFGVNWSSEDPVCGGDLVGSNFGSISSPGYPGDYPINRDCVWTVTVDAGMEIQFAFGTLQLEDHPTCDFDYLEIRDGLTESYVSLGKFCSTITPAPVTTTGPYAFLRFHSDSSLTDTGFHITYAGSIIDTGCGGALTDDSAIIISPNYPNAYPHNAECIWTMQVGINGNILFNITNLSIEEETTCTYDYIELRDGFDENALFVGRYCHADAVPPPFTSSSNALWLKFKTDGSVNAGGFRATYILACGGIFTDPSTQELVSPNFPDYYPHSKTCEYLINAPQGQIVVITFIVFDIEDHQNCVYDYLEIHDGSSENSVQLALLCGTALPPDVSTTNNAMYMKFVTDGSVANYGFRATFRFEDAGVGGCGGQFTDDTGTIESPPHPQGYPHGVTCIYTITVTSGDVIRLTFSLFNLEDSTNCVYDYVQIYDNSTNAVSPDLGRYCGSNTPPILTTTGNVMTIIFSTDSSVAYDGFYATYIALDVATLCGGALLTPTGVITTPNYPADYPYSRQCVWVISVPTGQQINVNFTDFDLELHSSCGYDFVELRNGGYDTSPLIGTFCGSSINPSSFMSHSNKFYIKFESDSSQSARGFSLNYDGTATGCGGLLTTPTGSFVSPNYPNPYSHNAECFWIMTTNEGSTLDLNFPDFDMETSSSCTYDYVKVFDGETENDALLGTFCGDISPPPLQSTDKSLRVKMSTDNSVIGGGFQATYQTNCDHVRLTKPNGLIESPNFPDPYPHNRDCTWIIETTEGNTVNLTFLSLNLEAHSTCTYDYIEVRDGQDDNSPLIGDKLCGQTPQTILYVSTDRYMLVKFHSDGSVADAGFQASYIGNGCGGVLTDNTGSLSSPNYPNHYDHDRVCTWSITVTLGHAITLTIWDFDVESSTDCQYDILEVFSGTDENGLSLARLCATTTKAQQASTTGNNMFVYFRTDSSVNGRGFNASYESIDGGCGGNFSTPSGSFHSTNFPNTYDHNSDCTWSITVEPYHRVQLNFTTFDLEDATSCVFDYVKLYDGSDLTAPLLATLCGSSLANTLYYSTSNQLFVHFLSDSSVANQGFQADYVTACGGRFDASVDGEIVSTNYPSYYPDSLNCTWIIESSNPGDRVILRFTHMDVEPSSSGCNFDVVSVYEGNDANGPLINQFCGTTIPVPITSFGSALTVNFLTDFGGQNTGFRALYSTSLSVCGGDFIAPRGSFTSPGYPANYPIDTECVWTIGTSPGNQVQVSFTIFDMESVCSNDYLEVRSGDENGALIGQYCGSQSPGIVTTTGTMWLKFKSDTSSTGIGFVADFAQVFGGTLIGPSGQIASPLYPNFYLDDLDVRWTIYVSSNRQVRIEFVDFRIEDGFFLWCFTDYLTVYDGADTTAPNLLTACGSSLPSPVETSGSVATVAFLTDGSITYSGWLLNWSEIGVGTTPRFPPTTDPNQCGGNLQATETPSNFSSPNYPGGYSDNQNCVWYISAPAGRTVKLDFYALYLEYHSTCSYDYIALYDNDVTSLIAKLCGRPNPLPASIHTTTNVMTAVFSSDGSYTYPGFLASYQAYCGGSQTSDSGTISSPLYPANYPDNEDCFWLIEATAGTTILVSFDSNFALTSSSSSSCPNDFVQLYNGGDDTSPPLGPSSNGIYCGTTAPADMETSSNMLRIRFVSDSTNSGQGFSLTYQAQQQACGGTRDLSSNIPSTDIMSSNYPNQYEINENCIWVVTSPTGTTIQLVFASPFYIEPHSSCSFDYVQVLDGSNSISPQLAKLCGTTVPAPILTTGSAAYIQFRTDSSVTHAGFKLTASIASCGGIIAGTSGAVTSPNYPNNYDNDLNCTWTIEAPATHYITFTVDSNFNVDNNNINDCSSGDVLRVYDGRSTSDFELAKLCGSSAPADFDSSANYAVVSFATDSTTVATGFSISFQSSVQTCGGDLVATTGTFTSPNYPNNYDHSRVCEWRITGAVGKAITLSFDDFQMEGTTGFCVYDYVEVFNGLETDAPSLGKFCGTVAPQAIVSSGNAMRVVFSTDGNTAYKGFSARYDSQDLAACGSVINMSPGTSGSFSSIGYPNVNYTNNLNCEWLLTNTATFNSSIYMSFAAVFDVETHPNCLYDAVMIYSGVDANAPLVESLCGSTRPDPVFFPQTSAFIRFITDSTGVGAGFRINYDVYDCGGTAIGTDGVITSPNFPGQYNHNEHCTWHVMAPVGTTITLNFTSFDIETHPNCIYDFVSVLNGGTLDSPQISGVNPWCGSIAPSIITASSNELIVIFSTDGSASAGGFRLVWTTANRGCGGTYHGNTGSIQSSNYPSPYVANEECVWLITAQSGYHILLAFDSNFIIAAGDSVEVFDGDSVASPSLGAYSGSVAPSPITSTQEVVTLRFRTDASNEGAGFRASWSTGCGATYNAVNTGTIVSPGYPSVDYPDNQNCEYVINWDPLQSLALSFNYPFAFQDSSGCYADGLIMYAGTDNTGTLLGTYCGRSKPTDMLITGPAYIRFYSDGNTNDVGFGLNFEPGCGGVFTGSAGTIQTPPHLDTYNHNQNCTWLITVSTTRNVYLKFTSMDIEPHSSCGYDYLEIFDGSDTSAPLLVDRLCGTTPPANPIISTGQSMLIVFFTDASVSGDGFVASYEEIIGPSSGCGGSFTAPTGTFQSVDLDGDGFYEPNLDCMFFVTVDPNKAVQFAFRGAFDIESSFLSCNYDYLLIRDGYGSSAPLIGQFCGTSIPADVTTSTNQAFVRFVSDSSIGGAGFTMDYSSVDPFCGGSFNATTASQTITSPNYPGQYPHNTRCTWYITAPDDTKHVRLTVTDFDVEGQTDCSFDYLEFKDFPTDNGLVQYCGTDMPAVYETSGQTAVIYFLTDGSSSGTGFSLDYSIANCSKQYTEDNGRVTSPGYPITYHTVHNCLISITTTVGSFVSLYFNNFDVEDAFNCLYDRLDIYDGPDSSAPLSLTLCGTYIPEPFFATSNAVFLNFITDISVQNEGFDITYTSSTTSGCGGQLTGSQGSFTSPGHPYEYGPNLSCDWAIEVPVGGGPLTLELTTLAIEGTEGVCATDSVEVFDGNFASPFNSFGQYCGLAQPAVLTASSRQMIVRFVTDGQNVPNNSTLNGFRAVFSS